MIEYKGDYTTAIVMTDVLDKLTIDQIIALVNDPSFTQPIVIMPDVHAGKGSVIGFTMELGNRIIPNIVGVDISCSLLAIRIDPKAIDRISDLVEFDQKVRQAIPMGMKAHNKPILNMERAFPYDEVEDYCRKFVIAYNNKFDTKYLAVEYSFELFKNMCERIGIDQWYAQRSLGTLGGNNHFIEIGKDEKGDVWVTVHSGSRNLGLKIANYWQKIAEKDAAGKIANYRDVTIKEIKHKFPSSQWQTRINAVKPVLASTKGLEYLEGEHMFGYFTDSIFAYFYAKINRELMMRNILNILDTAGKEVITSVHNYIDFKDMIIRKGAISSYLGQQILIPFNMEDGMLICLGRSNKSWNFSAPHGAGRVGSRTWANKQFDPETIKKRMFENGIFSSVVQADEVKGAYKDPKLIEKAISETAYVVRHVKPIIGFKAKNERVRK